MRATGAARRRLRRSALESSCDGEIITLVRQGETAATAELWRRHAAAGHTVARAWATGLDPDDLVSEAFLRVLRTIERGGGPHGAFRPYFFTSIRNVAASWGRKQGRERPLDLDEHDAAAAGPEEQLVAALDRDLSLRAFRALPARWQEVLWYTEVEGLSPAEVSPLLGLRPNAVAALSLRAREGLRGAWIQEHVADANAEGECRWVLERAGAHTRGKLPGRERLRLHAHLSKCVPCRETLVEAETVGRRLATVLLPLVAGAGAAAYLAKDSPGTTAPPGISGSGGGTLTAVHAGSSAGGPSVVSMTLVTAAFVLVGGVSVVAVVPGANNPSSETSAETSYDAKHPPTAPNAATSATEPAPDATPSGPSVSGARAEGTTTTGNRVTDGAKAAISAPAASHPTPTTSGADPNPQVTMHETLPSDLGSLDKLPDRHSPKTPATSSQQADVALTLPVTSPPPPATSPADPAPPTDPAPPAEPAPPADPEPPANPEPPASLRTDRPPLPVAPPESHSPPPDRQTGPVASTPPPPAPATPTNPPARTPAAAKAPPAVAHLTLTVTADPNEHLLPDAYGTAAPGAAVKVENAATGQVYATATADSNGRWRSLALPLPPGHTTLIARVDVESSDSVVVNLTAPHVLLHFPAHTETVQLVIAKDAASVQVIVDGVIVDECHVTFPLATIRLHLTPGKHAIGVRYEAIDGRVGATATTTIVVR
ncbi:sigma-70 family RNA polymerase sigma factor [Rathayibacter toxicus]|uniref:sigma-70 family RNA polymerase sigma factor n=1 Tax=Rathayibacter toxicus TaxID=145458 RepID=UPI001C040AB5|nr:sigma-70 family RNA polymerase sigma factor [Rathayibacter toxicus]